MVGLFAIAESSRGNSEENMRNFFSVITTLPAIAGIALAAYPVFSSKCQVDKESYMIANVAFIIFNLCFSWVGCRSVRGSQANEVERDNEASLIQAERGERARQLQIKEVERDKQIFYGCCTISFIASVVHSVAVGILISCLVN